MNIEVERFWYCPNCTFEDRTTEPRIDTRLHICAGLRGLYAPMLPKGTKAKVEAVERDDYVKDELVQLDPQEGRPVAFIVTTRDEGNDVIVFAPTATANASQQE